MTTSSTRNMILPIYVTKCNSYYLFRMTGLHDQSHRVLPSALPSAAEWTHETTSFEHSVGTQQTLSEYTQWALGEHWWDWWCIHPLLIPTKTDCIHFMSTYLVNVFVTDVLRP